MLECGQPLAQTADLLFAILQRFPDVGDAEFPLRHENAQCIVSLTRTELHFSLLDVYE
jgi:hypothetical protein